MAEKAEYLICHRYTGFEAYLMQVDGDQYYITFSAQEALRFHDLGEARTVAERMRAKLQDDEWTAELQTTV